jgi:formamidopyrimidine-DNA glycosylase
LSANYGPEPLTPEFTAQKLVQILKNKTTKIKATLLDQKLIAGLGNIYVDESLWAAQILPDRASSSLVGSEVKKLWQAIQRIIKQAISQRGTTFSDYRDSQGRRGNFSRYLQVYGRQGENCRRCGQPLQKRKLAGRGTHYCAHCQK